MNTLPLELQAMRTNATTPVISLGTLTTGLSFAVIMICLASVLLIQRRRARQGSDAANIPRSWPRPTPAIFDAPEQAHETASRLTSLRYAYYT